MKPYDIIKLIEKTAPLDAQAPWDASGIQVASPKTAISRAAVMLDPTLPALRQAVEAGADFILAHHPLSMKPRFPDRADDYLAILSLLFKHDVWLYSAHTSLDAAPDGPVRWLADDLGLLSVELLEPSNGSGTGGSGTGGTEAAPYGFGFTGLLPETLPYPAFCRLLAQSLGKSEWQVCGPVPERVGRVACCPGSGGGLLPLAVAAGADVFITGDFKYHAALDAGLAGLRVLDVGHFSLEEEMMRRFAVTLADALAVPLDFFPGRDPLAAERVPLS